MLYGERLRKVNIVGSYKLVNNPTYKHPYKAYLELIKRLDQEKAGDRSEIAGIVGQSSLNLNSPVKAH